MPLNCLKNGCWPFQQRPLVYNYAFLEREGQNWVAMHLLMSTCQILWNSNLTKYSFGSGETIFAKIWNVLLIIGNNNLNILLKIYGINDFKKSNYLVFKNIVVIFINFISASIIKKFLKNFYILMTALESLFLAQILSWYTS